MHRSLVRLILLAALVLAPLAVPAGLSAASAPAPARPTARPTYAVQTGEINGAKFAIARPTNWNRSVLILAHGLRAEDRPLVADLAPEHFAYKTLLEEGWIVAKTSYRRNGIIVTDAIADLDALRDYIERAYGTPERVILEGESMGGLIVTLLAERSPRFDDAARPTYTGAIAIGAALDVREPMTRLGLSLQPRIPLLFLTNQSELAGPQAYVEVPIPPTEDNPRPMLFRVSRDGHVNVNQRERLVAIRALNIWLDRGRDSLPTPPTGTPFLDVTVTPAPQPSQVVARADGRGFDARVIEVSAIYGNVFLNTQPADFAAAGIAPGDFLQLTVRGQNFRVKYGSDFSSVPRGEWVLFPNADGFAWLARNYADAAATAQIQVGDSVTILRLDKAKE
jgi:pimeloyl-ACP methyl ester carboxylesterase